jgi:hypothetical protein
MNNLFIVDDQNLKREVVDEWNQENTKSQQKIMITKYEVINNCKIQNHH